MVTRFLSILALVVFVSGCAFYRHNDYTLRFSNVQDGSPPDMKQLEVRFLHEVFPLNVPAPIYINLDDRGMVAMRLPNHFPTGFYLRRANSDTINIWFNLDLHSFRKEPAPSIIVRDKLTGDYEVVVTKRDDLVK